MLWQTYILYIKKYQWEILRMYLCILELDEERNCKGIKMSKKTHFKWCDNHFPLEGKLTNSYNPVNKKYLSRLFGTIYFIFKHCVSYLRIIIKCWFYRLYNGHYSANGKEQLWERVTFNLNIFRNALNVQYIQNINFAKIFIYFI